MSYLDLFLFLFILVIICQSGFSSHFNGRLGWELKNKHQIEGVLKSYYLPLTTQLILLSLPHTVYLTSPAACRPQYPAWPFYYPHLVVHDITKQHWRVPICVLYVHFNHLIKEFSCQSTESCISVIKFQLLTLVWSEHSASGQVWRDISPSLLFVPQWLLFVLTSCALIKAQSS